MRDSLALLWLGFLSLLTTESHSYVYYIYSVLYQILFRMLRCLTIYTRIIYQIYFHVHTRQCNCCNRGFSGCFLNKMCKSRVVVFLHGRLVTAYIRPRCWLRVLKLTRRSCEQPWSTSLPNIQPYLSMTS